MTKERPTWEKPFDILLLLDCHKMFNREYNDPIQNHLAKLAQHHLEICSQHQYRSETTFPVCGQLRSNVKL